MRFVLIIMALLASSTISYAQTAAISDEKMAIAEQIARLEKADETFEAVMGAVVRDTQRLFIKTNPDLENDIEEVGQQVQAQLMEESDVLMQSIIAIYASEFSESELQDILTFYQSPAGAALLARRSELDQRVLQETIQWGENMSEKAVAAMRKGLEAKGHRI
jgi:hypothetical protein